MFGFQNVGNTCFLNSVLQCLFKLNALNAVLDHRPIELSTPEQVFYKEFNDLRLLVRDGNCIVQPRRFVQAVRELAAHRKNADFSDNRQNDAAEFVLFLVDCLHDAMKHSVPALPVADAADTIAGDIERKCQILMNEHYKDSYSEMVQLFYGIHLSVIADEVKMRAVLAEPFMALEVPVKPHLMESLKAYCEESDLDWFDESSKAHIRCKQKIVIHKFPPILMINLKRFGQGKKNNDVVEIPLSFTITSALGEQNTYELSSVCNHTGSLNGGHYTAQVKINDAWTLVDDDAFTPSANFSNAYCMFYERC